MAEELEIKLSLTASNQQLALIWLLAQPGASKGKCIALINRYYDTPGGDLNRQRIALRVRQAGDQYIQTLKTQGDFVNGAHRRQEWEWPLAGPELNIGLIADTPAAQGITLAALKPVFETNFERQVVMIEDGDTVIEVAVDAGHIVAAEQKRPLHEIEFELKAGDAANLIKWARSLAADVPVFLNLISKAEQGYFLAGLHNPALAAEGKGARACVAVFLHNLSVAWLKGQPLAVHPDTLMKLEAIARLQSAEVGFKLVREDLVAGKPVAELADHKPLGQLQLALATV